MSTTIETVHVHCDIPDCPNFIVVRSFDPNTKVTLQGAREAVRDNHGWVVTRRKDYCTDHELPERITGS